ncbi:MAG: TIGR03960 family B12-binding radical SAM protein [Clostridia bacterium]|nr:TIGR03960 family B12-binding radical SAM protein [Clostridia bacterium]
MENNIPYERILKRVEKPGRYAGGEFGQTIKNKDEIKARFAFCFPDTYEIGMSNLGMRILYGSLNEHKDIWCERVFAPWSDMDAQMRLHNIPLCALESGDPVRDFDIVAFTLQYEMCYTTVLYMLELAGLELLACDREENDPVIIGGGPCAYNAEPIADFFDIFSIGEGEEALVELTELYIKMKEDGSYTKSAFLRAAAKLDGFYVPSLYEIGYNDDNTIKSITPKYDDVPAKITKRIISDMDKSYFPDKFVMPYIETVHDRITLEVYRGCIRGCRFCQAGMIYRPVREKSPEVLSEQAKKLYDATGYDEISLISLSISDYSKLRPLCEQLLEWTDDNMVSLSLPSLRADSFSKELMEKISSVRTSGLTFAPEAGTQRLRDAINKNVTEEDLMNACTVAFEGGKSQVKLYFMLGQPTETYEDLAGIAELADKVVDKFFELKREHKGEGGFKRPPSVTVSVSTFIPKPFTPFQWEAQDELDVVYDKQKYLESKMNNKFVKFHHHDAKVSRVEAVLARGDRRLSRVLLESRKLGMCFDAWDEFFDYSKWLKCFEAAEIDPAFYANRRFGDNEILPWDMIDCGVTKEFMLKENKKAHENITTPNCSQNCSACGANKLGGERSWCKRDL